MLSDFRNIRTAVLCSKQAPGLDHLLHYPSRNALYDLVCVLTTEEDFAPRAQVQGQGVPVLTHPLRAFHVEHGAPVRDRAVRAEYDAVTAGVLRKLDIDAVVCLGYTYVLTAPMLDAFDGRIFNVHDSDLTLLASDGSPRYAGLHSTRDAILAGESETRSTLHLVTPELDAGPIVARSDAFPIAPLVIDALAFGAMDILRAYAYAHREWMMRAAWGPMVVHLLESLAAGAELPALMELAV